MNKNTKNNISGTINDQKISLTELNGKEIEANLSNISLSSFEGAALLREEQYLALSHQLSSCITDNRVPYLVRHSIDEIIRTRLFQICLGYEDANDCNRLRKDPMLRTILPLLKPGRRNKTADVADTLKWLIMVLREAWPRTTMNYSG